MGLSATLKLVSDIALDSDDIVVCDARDLRFVDPVGLCLLAATCHRLAQAGKKLRLENVPPAITGYLSRMDLFKACGIEYDEQFTRHDRRADLVEICVADRAAEVDPLASRIATALVGVTPDYRPSAIPDEMTGYLPHDYLYKPLHHIFSELLENALTHAKRAGYGNARAWVAAQYYPTKDRMRLAVVDNGCGFLRSLARYHKLIHKHHAAAIRLALESRVTCNPDLDIRPDETANQGIGLTVVRQIVAESRAEMWIASGDSLLRLVGPRSGDSKVASWQGVVLALDFRRELLRQVNLTHIIHELTGKPEPRGLRFE